MTQKEILEIALRQSAVDSGCRPEDFLCGEPVIAESRADPGARRYLELPFSCDLVSYGSNVVASVRPPFRELAERYIRRFPPEHCFETPNLHVLNEALRPLGQKICFMAEYFLPELSELKERDCGLALRLLLPAELEGLYLPQWSNALCEKRRELDVLGVGAYEGGTLIGLAGCSADCGGMWQIGVDVLPAWRRRGVAAALTSRLALETLERGRVPFYCAAWSNLPSVRNALRSGFRPAWAELTAKPAAFVDALNGAGKEQEEGTC